MSTWYRIYKSPRTETWKPDIQIFENMTESGDYLLFPNKHSVHKIGLHAQWFETWDEAFEKLQATANRHSIKCKAELRQAEQLVHDVNALLNDKPL